MHGAWIICSVSWVIFVLIRILFIRSASKNKLCSPNLNFIDSKFQIIWLKANPLISIRHPFRTRRNARPLAICRLSLVNSSLPGRLSVWFSAPRRHMKPRRLRSFRFPEFHLLVTLIQVWCAPLWMPFVLIPAGVSYPKLSLLKSPSRTHLYCAWKRASCSPTAWRTWGKWCYLLLCWMSTLLIVRKYFHQLSNVVLINIILWS